MQNKPKRVVNKRLAATSTVRLIEAMMPKDPEEAPVVIVKPRPKRKQIPGAKLLIKLAKDREKVKQAKKNVSKKETDIDMTNVEIALDEIMRDLA